MRIALALALSLAAQGCFADEALPGMVLDGTDVFPFADYPPAPADVALAGSYGTETGGAGARLRLAPSGDALLATRRIDEPGMAPDTATYRFAPSGACFDSEDDSARLCPVETGVLLLERAGGDLVPGDLWTHYPALP